MNTELGRPYSELVVAVLPTERDGEVTRRILARGDIQCVVAKDWQQVEAHIREGVGALLVTDIALADSGSDQLLRVVDSQPGWSNLPVLALCRDGLHSPALGRALRALRNVTVLDRPASTKALVSAVEAALRGRRWQYQIRDQIHELVQADRALRQADQRKDEFLATLAHELRNPLAPIRTGLQILTQVPPKGAEFVRINEMMGRQLSHLVRLIDELLEVSRISTGKLVLQRERLDLRKVVATALEACQPLVDRARHRVTVTLPEHEVLVSGDATRLAQSLSNLVNNAAKYTPDGGRIGVTLSCDAEQATLAVADNGLGIPADMLERVFDMFAQVNRTLERSQGGLGIGLALVRSLVGLHGGLVTASSPGPGQGSTFAIRMPLLGDDEDGGGADTAAAGAVPEHPQAPRRLRVLVVDDNADAADSLAMLMSLNHHDVRVAHDGLDALRTAPLFMPHAIFCDIGMPGVGGFELASRLRHDPRFARTLLVAVTGWGGEEDQRRSRGAGFDAHLTKPASPESVSQLLARL